MTVSQDTVTVEFPTEELQTFAGWLGHELFIIGEPDDHDVRDAVHTVEGEISRALEEADER